MADIVTQQEVADYLGVSITDARFQRRCSHLIQVADTTLKSGIGENYPINDVRAKELALVIISDLYDNHDYTDKVSGNVRKLIYDFSLQLKLELAISEEGEV